jgi:hypothetical protein
MHTGSMAMTLGLFNVFGTRVTLTGNSKSFGTNVTFSKATSSTELTL